ncbi:MAG: carbamoyltransferase HypF [Eubacteriales bacterium]|jgi:hydrogenase maturation protein HypF
MIRKKIRLYGIVQGIGFRPFVSRLAAEYHIAGDVCNKGSYVEIHAEGTPENVAGFRKDLVDRAPAVSAIIRVEEKDEKNGEDGRNSDESSPVFRIIPSQHEAGEIFVSPDLATCPKCRQELFDPKNRRYLHPFINCTDCGPRLTILDSMPYDRERTSMAEFPMCGKCEYEYTHPETRRFHAQPVCCNDDGPQLFIPGRPEKKGDALIYVRKVIREGGIAAIKGIGGFHLCCDARNADAVARLRRLKNRPAKPFAVMMRDMDTVRKECVLLPGEEKIMTGVQKPILLLEKRGDSVLPDVLAPGNPYLGVMLPYAPVQMLLFDYPDAPGEDNVLNQPEEENGVLHNRLGLPMTDVFVMTSGNPSGAPICRTTEEAEKYLSPMCDVILSNDRKIRLRADDSVSQFVDGKLYMIRRSRGYAPLPSVGPGTWKGQIFAAGGELKNTFVLARDELYYPSPYIGDLADIRSVRALESAVTRMERLLEIRPEAVACDLHPRYNSTAFAEEKAKEKELPLIYVQHHYAHILSCMAENEMTDPVIGISFDGTGYGTDGTIWGGEFLIADPVKYRRIGSLASFAQSGGDASSREGWRIAVSLIFDAYPESFGRAAEVAGELGLCDEKNLKMQHLMHDKGINTVRSTSVGRLFDAVCAILGIRRQSTFEGEASMALEFAAETWEKKSAPPVVNTRDASGGVEHQAAGALEYCDMSAGSGDLLLTMKERGPSDGQKNTGGDTGEPRAFDFSWEAMIRQLTERRLAGEDTGRLAYEFHLALAKAVLEGAEFCRQRTGISTVALSGGCFQNLLLLRLCCELLEGNGFRVLRHSMIPTNDGGIALGQAFHAMAVLNEKH